MTDSTPATAAPLTPAERMRHASYLLGTGATIPTDCAHLRRVLIAVLDQEAIWADDHGDRYPDSASVVALADAVRASAVTGIHKDPATGGSA